jgi:phytoene desaturase
MVRILPDLLRLSGYRSVSGLVGTKIRDKRLRIALGFHPLLVGGNPLNTSAIYCLILHLERKFGVHFPAGGTGALVRGMVQLIESQGNRLRTNATVSKILVKDDTATGVQLAGGEVIAADIVVSNACAAATYQQLLGGRKRRRWTDRKIARAKFSMGLFVWYFGTNRTYQDIGHHTILMGPRYRELLDDIFVKKHLARDFSLYLHRPTATDPSLAPAGADAFYVLAPVPNLKGHTDWRQEAEPYRRRIEAFLEANVLPGLSKSVVTSHVMTPLDFQTDLLAYQGAAFGMEPILSQSAWFRPHNRSEDVEHLYLVGAGTHPGAGLPGVLSSARILDQVVPDASQLV